MRELVQELVALPVAAGHLTRVVADAVAAWRGRVDLVEVDLPQTPAAVLIRPDGYVAWAHQPGTDPCAGLRPALRRWFGEPTDTVAPAAHSLTAEGAPS